MRWELRPGARLQLGGEEEPVGGEQVQGDQEPVQRHRSGLEAGRVQGSGTQCAFESGFNPTPPLCYAYVSGRFPVRRGGALRVRFEARCLEQQVRDDLRWPQPGARQAAGQGRQGGHTQVDIRVRIYQSFYFFEKKKPCWTKSIT